MPIATVAITDYAGAFPNSPNSSNGALNLAFGALTPLGGGIVYFPSAYFTFDTPIVIPANIILRGQGKRVSTIKRGNNSGPVISQMGQCSGIEHMTVDGNSSAYNIIEITSDTYQTIMHSRVIGTTKAALYFAATAGNEFRAFNSEFVTSGAVNTVAAIKTAGDGGAGCPRHFTNCGAEGCTLYDLSGANDTFVTGGYTNSIITSDTTSKLLISNIRFGDNGGALPSITIKGENLSFQNCVFACPVILTCKDSIFNCIVGDWNVTDNGTGNSVFQRFRDFSTDGTSSPKITWSSSGTQPVIGTGKIHASWSREGAKITLQVEFTFAGVTSFGTGTWRFSLPRADLWGYNILAQVTGSGLTQGNPKDFTLVPRVTGGTSYVELMYTDAAGALAFLGGSSTTWSTSGNLRFTLTYLTK